MGFPSSEWVAGWSKRFSFKTLPKEWGTDLAPVALQCYGDDKTAEGLIHIRNVWMSSGNSWEQRATGATWSHIIVLSTIPNRYSLTCVTYNIHTLHCRILSVKDLLLEDQFPKQLVMLEVLRGDGAVSMLDCTTDEMSVSESSWDIHVITLF